MAERPPRGTGAVLGLKEREIVERVVGGSGTLLQRGTRTSAHRSPEYIQACLQLRADAHASATRQETAGAALALDVAVQIIARLGEAPALAAVEEDRDDDPLVYRTLRLHRDGGRSEDAATERAEGLARRGDALDAGDEDDDGELEVALRVWVGDETSKTFILALSL